MMSHFMSRQFLVFLVAGGVAAAVNFGTRILYNQAMPFSAAVVCSYVTGMVTAFVLNRMFVFRDSSQPTHHAIGFFVLVNLVAIVQSWAVSMGMLYYVLPYFGITDHAREIAHAVGIVIPVFSSYLGHKHFSFR